MEGEVAVAGGWELVQPGAKGGPGHWQDPARVIGLQPSGLGHSGGPVPAAHWSELTNSLVGSWTDP